MVDDIDNNYIWGIFWIIFVILRLIKLIFFFGNNLKVYWMLYLCIYFDYFFILNWG